MRSAAEIRAKGLAQLHAALVVGELARAGVDLFCVSPGARAIPLIAQLNAAKLPLKLFNDERSAAFWAQGYAKAGGLPCLVSTSGTAVANYLPGAIEASMAGAPLLILTADRPAELLYAKANQTIDQKQIFGSFARATFDIPAPEVRLHVHSLLANIDQAVACAKTERGPVQINVAYRKPFETDCAAALDADEAAIVERWCASREPYCAYAGGTRSLTSKEAADLAAEIDAAKSVLIVCGPLPARENHSSILELAAHLDAPIFADINSGLRFHPENDCVSSMYNAFLPQAGSTLGAPELVLYFGDRLVSEPVQRYLEQCASRLVLVSDYPGRQDAVENEFLYPALRIVIPPRDLAAALLGRCGRKSGCGFSERVRALEAEARTRLLALSSDGGDSSLSEAAAVTEIFSSLPDESGVFLASSLIFREAEYFAASSGTRLAPAANRGATGIDGILSSGLGYAARLGRPTAVLLGDQAMLHDLNALTLASSSEVPVLIFVINNFGGAIFNFFALGETTELLINSHRWSFEGMARACALEYRQLERAGEIRGAIADQLARGSSAVFEIRVDGRQSVRQLQSAGGTPRGPAEGTRTIT